MTVQQLAAALARLLETRPDLADAPVLHDVHGPIEGGIVARPPGGGPVLILAPVRLDQVGGF